MIRNLKRLLFIEFCIDLLHGKFKAFCRFFATVNPLPPPFFSGFAKSRPAAQRPAAHGPRRPSDPAARRPIGPRPTARDGPAARRPSPDFPQSFCPAVNPRTCTDLHRVWACKMDDGKFEFVYHFNNHFNPIRPFLLLHVAK